MIVKYPGTISLGQGVVGYGPPESALDVVRGFGGQADLHRYGSVYGQSALLEQITRKLQAENEITLGCEQNLMVTAGSNMAFLNAILAIADPDDEIILPLPFYFNHEMAIRMIGCKAVGVPTDATYHLDFDALRASITTRTRAIVTVSPNNPTGAVYAENQLREVNRLCHEHGLFHICDEAYEYFTWGGAIHYSPASMPEAKSHTISLYSLSKAYALAGWRIGYAVYPAKLDEAMVKVQDTNLICAPLISQAAAMAALKMGRSWCDPHLRRLSSVRDIVLGELQKVSPGCQVSGSEGAFYVLLKVDTPLDSFTLVQRLISEHGVAVIPGQAFGMQDGCYLRIAYGALDAESVLTGLARLTGGLQRVLLEPA